MSVLDFVVLGIIIITSIIAYSRGLIRTVFSLCSMVIGIILTYTIFPTISKLIIQYTDFHDQLKVKLIEGFQFNHIAQNAVSPQDQRDLISGLEVPDFFKQTLQSNNNNEVYKLFNVQGLDEYLGSMMATVIINAIVFIVLFMIIMIILNIAVSALDLIAKLPILHQLNKLGGLIAGLVFGVVIVWVVCVAVYIGVGIQGTNDLLALIQQSTIAKFFYNHNLLIDFVTDITKTL